MICAYQNPLQGECIGIVFGSFAPLHQGHLDLIMRAKKENDGCLVISCGFDGDKGEPLMPHERRYRYVREFFSDDELVAVYAINDTEIGAEEYPNGWGKWMGEFENIFHQAVCQDNYQKRVWYVGEESYYNDLTNMGEEVILLDRVADNPISATMIRKNPIKHWDKITYPFKRVFSTNILVCGTASEGKSTLVKDLGKYFNTPHSHEYARDYMESSHLSEWELCGIDYMNFLIGQYQLNRDLINSQSNHGIFIADTDSMVTRMYAEYYSKDPNLKLTQDEFEEIAVAADAITKKCRWDKIYLICPGGTFVDDHTRYMAYGGIDVRQELFEILCKNIRESGNWDKVTILNEGYYKNFARIVSDIKEVIENGKMD